MATTVHISDVAELLSEGRTHFNLSPGVLVEHSIRRNEAKLAANGAIVGYTNRTGRSPKDKFIVRDEMTADTVAWGPVNSPIEPARLTEHATADRSTDAPVQVTTGIRIGIIAKRFFRTVISSRPRLHLPTVLDALLGVAAFLPLIFRL